MLHSPSLVQHVGQQSSLGPKGIEVFRRAATWVEDARSLA